ncbi:MAG: tetraacyldisaccharide 4'-kinase [Lentimicrobiaceae bacterium]|nr:tetraacyldisaccharide 4'-kinase [Lentimicrobiaceae bacterium]
MKRLLLPISLLYSFVLFLRHKLYDWKILKSKSYNIPNICVGNLNLGGTGKTPHIEYLIRLLSDKYDTAVLSRGYRRKTQGYLLANDTHTHNDIGDEPLQYFTKFNNIKVAVDESRCEGMDRLLQENKPPQVVLLDDAYQHRKIKPGLNILLTDYYSLYSDDHLVPAGNLRDIKKAAQRAEIIVVTKSPNVITPYYRRDVENKLKPLPHQKVFYSYIEYLDFQPLSKISHEMDIKEAKTVLLLCGIANTYSLEDHIKRKYNTISKIKFNDHHNFTEKDVDMIIEKYNHTIGKNKVIVTTEKDAMRLINTSFINKFDDIPVFTIPIKIKFHKEEGTSFDDEILKYINDNIQ